MKKVLKKIRYVKLKHIIGIIPFLLLIIPAFLYKIFLKITGKKVWLVCEQHNTARDNGYWFFKYMCENHKEIKTIYAIDTNCDDYNKVKDLGKVIKFGKLAHYFYYMSCDKNISSHKDGNPNELVFTIMHLYLNLYNNRIFLCHGINKDDIDMFYYENTKFKMFTCGAKDEYDYLKKNFHYKTGVVYTGLARFDGLHDIKVNEKQIAVIPTWRNYLGRETNSFVKEVNILDTDYFKNWNSFLNDEKLINYLEKNDITLIFYPHIMMQKFIENFKSTSKNIKVVKREDMDIQTLMKESKMLITDYSSVFFDFGYMKKTTLYFQFDYDEYRSKHLKEGYFSYKNNGFGEVCETKEELVNTLIDYIKNNLSVKEKYLKRMNSFFEINDQNNCKRIYEEIMKLD